MRCSGIIVAAGSGKRFGGKKQFERTIKHHIVLDHSVEAVSRCVDELIIVTSEEDMEYVSKRYKVKVVKGGKRRMDSVFSGLLEATMDYVLIHDAARPLITTTLITQLITNAVTYGASILAVPIRDTIKKTKDGFSLNTINRENMYAAQTPQAFERTKLISAYKQAIPSGKEYTDEASVWETFIGKVHITPGSYKNIKITTREDLEVVRCLLGVV